MKHKFKYKPILYTAVILAALFAILVVTAVGMFFYVFAIPEPEGLSLASWPNQFTNDFSFWIEEKDGRIGVKQSGLKLLDKYGLWIQIVDETGQEIFSYHKPAHCPKSYSMAELVALSDSTYENGHTVFISDITLSCRTLNYIMGFPYAIGKTMLYYNGGNMARLSPFAKKMVFFCACVIVLAAFAYAFWLSRKLSAMIGGIRNIAGHSYQPMRETGIFSEVYSSLNKMDMEIRRSEKIQQETDHIRKEWIANITHDLKTPLSPVKGYAELLSECRPEGRGLDLQTVQDYGTIILKNANHMEKLMNDLKLTYQLEAGAVPFAPLETRIVRFLKELFIDIANDPAFSNREIEFESSLQELTIAVDPGLMRRAVGNIVINALVHNPADTKVRITVSKSPDSSLSISICDNGNGMDEAELSGLWSRYYRGTSTKERPEGSGLGLAIAKQIIMLHGGDIFVKSSPGDGTEFIILLPFETDAN